MKCPVLRRFFRVIHTDVKFHHISVVNDGILTTLWSLCKTGIMTTAPMSWGIMRTKEDSMIKALLAYF